MSLYTPRHYAGDEAAARQLIRDYPFATLVTGGADEPHISHVPLLLDDAGTALLGHVARANPLAERLGGSRSLAIFHGPHAFVSRTWYEHPAANVPTWNYATVHVTGRATVLDARATRESVERLSARFEPSTAPPTDPARLESLLKAIVAFRLPIERMDVKLKMSQNKTARDRAGVVRGLLATGRPEDAAVARWMQDHDPD